LVVLSGRVAAPATRPADLGAPPIAARKPLCWRSSSSRGEERGCSTTSVGTRLSSSDLMGLPDRVCGRDGIDRGPSVRLAMVRRQGSSLAEPAADRILGHLARPGGLPAHRYRVEGLPGVAIVGADSLQLGSQSAHLGRGLRALERPKRPDRLATSRVGGPHHGGPSGGVLSARPNGPHAPKGRCFDPAPVLVGLGTCDPDREARPNPRWAGNRGSESAQPDVLPVRFDGAMRGCLRSCAPFRVSPGGAPRPPVAGPILTPPLDSEPRTLQTLLN
jgi:hypothetical protein